MPGKTKQKFASAQEFLPIEEIKEGVVTLKEGGLRAVLLIRGTNFGLKSEDEQNAIINSYQGFLNSLEFPLQILTRSKKIDLTPYLKKLEVLEKSQTNELLLMQTVEYVDFIKKLTEIANVMSKEFYAVVPFNASAIKKGGVFSQLTGLFSKGAWEAQTKATFEQNKAGLDQRVEVTKSGLEGIGLKVAQLNTEELIELFYNIYNPEVAYQEKLTQMPSLGEAIEKEVEK